MLDYLIIARSGRAIAASAKRAGHKVAVLDCFNDEDTKSFSEAVYPLHFQNNGFDVDELLEYVRIIISQHQNAKIVIGSGFESNPEMLDRLAEIAPLLCNSKETIVKLKDPISFYDMLDRNGIAFPEYSVSRAAFSKKMLRKKIGDTGGGHVAWSDQVNYECDSNCYFQEYIPGKVSSVVFLANGSETKIVGYNLQLQSDAFTEMPFLYQGAISLNSKQLENRGIIENIVNIITKETGLKGLCGLDYIVKNSGDIVVLEVNPRPPATFELHEERNSMFNAHLDCFNGKLLHNKNNREDEYKHKGYSILYAKKDMFISDKVKWPDWVKDKPSIGSRIPAQNPVCTVHAEGISIDKVKTVLLSHLQKIESIIVAVENAA